MFEEDDGSVSRLTFNPDIIETQIADYMVERMRDRRLDAATTMSHMFRYFAMNMFLRTHMERLIQEGLITRDPDDEEAVGILEPLVEVLATSRYEGKIYNQWRDENERSFDLNSVIRLSKQRRDEGD